jgi:ankyrin repeat protein
MTARQLPERPNLDQLKRQAKDLLHSARARDHAALARFRILPSFARRPDGDLERAPVALHDAQSVVAREYGFDSWNALRERVEELTFEFGTAVEQFVEAATGRRRDRAERLLKLHPGIAGASFHTALIVGDAAAVEARLTADPALAVAPGGPRGWEPLHYVCHSVVGSGSAEREAGRVAIARRLIALGADPNTRFPWEHHGVRRPALWGAVCVVGSLALARALLEAGANPDDGVTLTLAAGMSDIAALELLRAHGANVNHPWATDGGMPLYEILHWAGKPDGARWLIEHGGAAHAAFAGNGETPLHVVAESWGPDLAELLVTHDADVNRRRSDGRTPYAVAELSGNRAVAEWLAAHGADQTMADVDRLVAACSRGDRAQAAAMLQRQPGLRAEISAEHYRALYRAAERNDTSALEAMLAAGFAIDRPDESIGKTALHVAAMEGWPEAVRVLLAHGASVSARDREFKAQPLIWAAEGARTSRTGRDHAAVGRLLLDAGSPIDWEPGAEPSEPILDIVNAWRGVTSD